MLLVFEKAIAIAIALRYLKVFDTQSFFAYVAGVGALFIFSGFRQDIPELLLFFIAGFFFLYLLALTVREKGTKLFKVSFEGIREASRIFFAGFVFAYLFSMVSLGNPVAIFLGILVFHLVLNRLKTQKPWFLKNKFFDSVTYPSVAVFLFFASLVFGRIDLLLMPAYYGVAYTLFLLAYSAIFSVFTQEMPLARLNPGMLPAEQITKKGKNYKKRMPVYLSPQFYIRSKMLQKIEGEEEVIKPTRPLSKGDILMIKNISKAYGFRTFMVQRRIDMRFFVLAGVFGTCASLLI